MAYVPPTRMRDRWENRPALRGDQGTVYWHVLFRDNHDVQSAASAARARISDAAGLHLTPAEWLHMTLMMVGPADELEANLQPLLSRVQARLADVRPIYATVGDILYHPEGVVLGLRPVRALRPLRHHIETATRRAVTEVSRENEAPELWLPHVTLAYSTLTQPARDIISALGHVVGEREVFIDTVSLVVQWGPEQSWNWQVIDTIRLGESIGF